MAYEFLGWPGKFADAFVESLVVSSTLTRQVASWLLNINRLRILGFTKRTEPELYAQLDGGDKRIMRAFLDPDSLSNTWSVLGGKRPPRSQSELGLSLPEVVRLLQDAMGTESTFDNSFVERDPGADEGVERWFFINGIATSRDLARRSATQLSALFGRPFTLIHNPTQGLTNDLLESALQKFTNVNSEPAAHAFLEITNALLDDSVREVVVIAHSQGTIIVGDVLDLVYCSIDRRFFDRTNMNDEDYDAYMNISSGTVKAAELRHAAARLKDSGVAVLRKLQLYMFANAASRMCYADAEERFPHIESYANEHDIVARLGSLARDDFHKEDLIHIDGPLFTCDRYGHLLGAHYLPDFQQGHYQRKEASAEPCIGTSVHDPVRGNPCANHPKYVAGDPASRLLAMYRKASGLKPKRVARTTALA